MIERLRPRHVVAAGTSPSWDDWRGALNDFGERSAEDGMAHAHAHALLANLSHQMYSALGTTYASTPQRLIAVLRVQQLLIQHGLLVVASAHLEHERALARARENDLATTLHSIGDAVLVTDEHGMVRRVNSVAERLTGFSASECVGKPLSEVFRIEHETTGELVPSPVDRVLKEGVVVGLANHTVLVSRNGTRCPIADSGAPVRGENGEIRGVVLVFRDVSEERRSQVALEHWERIFQHATWGVAVASIRDVRFTAVNPAYAAMHGYTVAELLGAPVSTLWAAETRSDMERHAAETHDHGRLVVETTHMTKAGVRLPVEVVATTIKNAAGETEWFVANVQDISERKRFQQSKLRAVELQAENRRIEEANRLKSEFLASMSHELRTPLNSVIGFAELLHDNQVGDLSETQKEFLGEILGGGRHLLRLINDVLDLAKVEAGKIELRPEPVELAELVTGVVNGLRATARGRNLGIDVKFTDSLGEVILDAARFKQILYNYVSNAIKFTPDGGRIEVRVTPEGEKDFRLEVEDTGIGVAEEDAGRLFTAFQQIESAETKRHGGTGLGLALTKRLAEAQSGSVGMRSSKGHGSVFHAVLPRRPEGYARSDARPDVCTLGTILAVDADTEHRRVLVEMLTHEGYRVEAVGTYEEALAAWQRHTCAAVVLDLLDLSVKEQRNLVHALRSDTRGAPPPVLAFSIVSGQDPAGFAVTDVLAKPVDKEQLLAALRRSCVVPLQGSPIVVIDDDLGSLKLMAATLGQLGYHSLCFSGAAGALAALKNVRPAAIVLDLIMPDMDGLAFLEHYRTVPENRTVPVMLWTVKDLSTEERDRLHAAVNAIVQKGIQDGSRLAVALQNFLGATADVRTQQ